MIKISNWRWLGVHPQKGEGGAHDGTYRIVSRSDGGKNIILFNGPNLSEGTVVKLDSADVTVFTTADGTKHK
jgi:hypothetical protein